MNEKPDIESVLLHFGAEWVPEGSRWRKMRCILPDHDDKHPSASVNHDTGKYACMACDFNGDAYDLIQKITGGDFRAAVLYANTVLNKRSEQLPPVDDPGGRWIPSRQRDNERGGAFRPPWLNRGA